MQIPALPPNKKTLDSECQECRIADIILNSMQQEFAMGDVRLVDRKFDINKVEKDFNIPLQDKPVTKKVSWIKAFRAVTGYGLKEGKELYESLEQNLDTGVSLNNLPEYVINNLKHYDFGIEEENDVDMHTNFIALVDIAVGKKEYELAQDLLEIMKKNNM